MDDPYDDDKNDKFYWTKIYIRLKDILIDDLKAALKDSEIELNRVAKNLEISEATSKMYKQKWTEANQAIQNSGGEWKDYRYLGNSYAKLKDGKKYYVMLNGQLMRMRWKDCDWWYKGQIHLGVTQWLDVQPIEQYEWTI